MLTERNENEISESVRNFISSNESQGIVIFPLSGSEIQHDKFNVIFCAAGFVQDQRGEKVDFVTFTTDGERDSATKFHREIFEWDNGDTQGGVEDLDGWLQAAYDAYYAQDPLFAISFGTYETSGERAVFIHAQRGVSQNSAINILKRFAEIKLFGGEFKVNID